jgi:hypothetical protein
MLERKPALVESQITLLLLRAVTLKAMATQDRKNIASEIGRRFLGSACVGSDRQN